MKKPTFDEVLKDCRKTGVLLVCLIAVSQQACVLDRHREKNNPSSDVTKQMELDYARSLPKYVPKPEVMSLMIGGYSGPSFEILLDGRELRYYAASSESNLGTPLGSPTVVLHPTDEQWQAFLDNLTRLNVWKWRHDFDLPGAADGTQWRVVIIYRDHEIIAFGNNAYPKEFDDFLAAVRKFIGGRDFE